MRWNLNMIIHEAKCQAVSRCLNERELMRVPAPRSLAPSSGQNASWHRQLNHRTTEPQPDSLPPIHRLLGPCFTCLTLLMSWSPQLTEGYPSSLCNPPQRAWEQRETLKITRSLITLTNITASFVHYWIVVKRWIHVHANIFTAHILLLMTWKFYICILNAQLNLGCKSSPRLFQRSPVSDSDGGQNLCMPLEHQSTHVARVLAPWEMTRLYMWPV